jgi:hypothetical protein
MNKFYWCSCVELPQGSWKITIILERDPDTVDLQNKISKYIGINLKNLGVKFNNLEILILPMLDGPDTLKEIQRWGVDQFFDPTKEPGYMDLHNLAEFFSDQEYVHITQHEGKIENL